MLAIHEEGTNHNEFSRFWRVKRYILSLSWKSRIFYKTSTYKPYTFIVYEPWNSYNLHIFKGQKQIQWLFYSLNVNSHQTRVCSEYSFSIQSSHIFY